MKVLGIDPGYSKTGFAIIEDKKLIESMCLDLSKHKTKREKRKIIKNYIQYFESLHKPSKVIIERVRLFSHGFISTKTIVALGTIISSVIDATELDVYSVDSRSFKKRVVGNSSCSKADVIKWVYKKFGIDVEEDEADSIAIAYYQFVENPLLKKENN